MAAAGAGAVAVAIGAAAARDTLDAGTPAGRCLLSQPHALPTFRPALPCCAVGQALVRNKGPCLPVVLPAAVVP